MRILKFDHPIIMVKDLQKAESEFRKLGFGAFKRPDVGESDTEVRFITFGDGSYMELFSFKDPSQPSKHRWWPLVPRGEGWVDYCVHVEDASECITTLNAQDMPVSESRLVGKSLVDGRAWKVTCVDAGLHVGSPVMPVFIQDLAPREIRVPPPMKSAFTPDEGAGVVGVTVVAEKIADVEAVLTATYGSGRRVAPRVEGAGAAMLFSFMGRWLELIEPVGATGPVAEHLKARGEGVYEVTVGWPGRDTPGDGTLMPLEVTRGARLRVCV